MSSPKDDPTFHGAEVLEDAITYAPLPLEAKWNLHPPDSALVFVVAASPHEMRRDQALTLKMSRERTIP